MKKGHVYTFVFMIVITAVLVFALAAAYEGFKPAIAANRGLQQQRAVLSALGLDKDLKDSMVADAYLAAVQPGSLGGVSELKGQPILAHVQEGQVQAYALPFEGSALWGSIRGYLGVTADLSQTTGLVFTYQNETPGLGGRIDEAEFKDRFRGLKLTAGEHLVYGKNEADKPEAITGATQTSSAVLRTLNQLLDTAVFGKEGK